MLSFLIRKPEVTSKQSRKVCSITVRAAEVKIDVENERD